LVSTVCRPVAAVGVPDLLAGGHAAAGADGGLRIDAVAAGGRRRLRAAAERHERQDENGNDGHAGSGHDNLEKITGENRRAAV
jgi:hypothetical protein